jgi:cation transport ATPase
VVGDELIGGSVNVTSPLAMRVLRLGQDTRLAAITRLMERAAAEKPPSSVYGRSYRRTFRCDGIVTGSGDGVDLVAA